MPGEEDSNLKLEDQLSKAWDELESGEINDAQTGPDAVGIGSDNDEGGGDGLRQEAQTETTDQDQDQTEAEEVAQNGAEEAEEDIAPPPTLTPDEVEGFKTLPPEAKKYVVDRELKYLQAREDAYKGSHKYSDLERAVQQYQPHFDKYGMSVSDVVRYSLAQQAQLAQDPKGYLRSLAQQYGVDFSQPDDYDDVDPQVSQLTKEIEAIKQAQISQSQQQLISSVTSEIERFKNEKGEDGRPLRPYFEEVRAEMRDLVGILRQRNPQATDRQLLQEAYNQAVWLNESTRAKLSGATTKKRSKTIPLKKVKEVDSPSKSSRTGIISGSHKKKPKFTSFEDAVAAAWDFHSQ